MMKRIIPLGVLRNFVISVFLLCSPAVAETQLAIPYKVDSSPSSSAGLREAYGRVSYSVDFAVDAQNSNAIPHPGSVENSLKSFLRNQVSRAFGGENGNYVLTISLLSGSKVVAKKALLSFAWSERNFLFFTTDSSLTGSLSRSGVLTDNFPIRLSNNLMNVQLRLQRSDSIFVETETFNEFSEQISLLSFETLQPALEIMPSVQTAIGVMSKVLNTNEEVDISNDVALRFLDHGTDAPSGITFSLRGPKNRKEPYFKNGVNVTINFEVENSLFSSFTNGSFQTVDYATTLPFAVVGASAASLAFEDAINAKRYETIRSYLASLQRGTFPADATANSVCRELWDTLVEFFSINDAPLVYAAYLRRYDFELNVAGANRQCLERYSDTFARLGIPTSQIQISN